MEASTNCFFVVVGGKYLRLMENVLKIVDNVTEAVGRRPIAVIYVTKDEKITSFYDQPFHLPLVNNLTYTTTKFKFMLNFGHLFLNL